MRNANPNLLLPHFGEVKEFGITKDNTTIRGMPDLIEDTAHE
jgi:hypothetical protein